MAPVGDYVAIADAMARLLTDRQLHASMSDVIRRRVETTYNKLTVDRIYNDLYLSMLSRDRNAPAELSAAWPA